jgi:hypothetical protein
MATFINCTPHAITVAETVFEPSGSVARVNMETEILPSIDGFNVETATPVGLENLPETTDGVYLIVSAMVLEAGKKLGRSDLVAPNTSKAIRNEKGHIVSVPGFVA